MLERLDGEGGRIPEAEAALAGLAGIASSRVVRRSGMTVAFVVVDDASTTTNDAAIRRAWPVDRVLAVDAPTLVHPLDDDRSWPYPDDARAECGGVVCVSPHEGIEAALAACWADVLGEPCVGRFDDFRGADGHSILVVQVVARLKAAFGIQASPRDLLEGGPLWRVARRIEVAAAARHVEALATDAPSTLVPATHGPEGAPLSPCQEGLWHAMQQPGSEGLYNISLAWEIEGALDADALQSALRAIVDRHDALRTAFVVTSAGVRQRVTASAPVALPILVPEGAEDAAAFVDRVRSREAREGFDISCAPLLRARLLRPGTGRHVLVLTVHHLVADGWSMGLLARQWSEACGRAARPAPAERGSTDAPCPPGVVAPGGPADPARERAAVDWWSSVLAPTLPAIELPFDRPDARPGDAPADAAESVAMSFPADLEARLQAATRSLGCTLFELLSTALLVWLARCTGQHDVRIGYAAACREDVDCQDVVGCFVNTLVLRMQVEGHRPLRALVADASRQLRDASRHQSLPLERLIGIAAPHGEPGAVLVPVMLNLNLNDTPVLSLAGARVRALPRVSVGSPFGLTWIVSRHEGALAGRIEFDARRFVAEDVRGMGRQLATLLHAMADGLEGRVHDLEWLCDGDREALLRAAGRTAAVGPAGQGSPAEAHGGPLDPVQALFDRRVQLDPAAPALRVDGRSIDYQALQARANRLAHLLRSAGAGPDVPVGVCLPRGGDAVVALLAILKAGACYLPLDKDQPPKRLSLMRDEAGARLVVTIDALRPLLGRRPGDRFFCLDTLEDALRAQPTSDPAARVAPAQLAYCLYTSGSTGRPKGVQVSVRALAGHVRTCIDRYALAPADRVLQFAATTFDTAIEQMLAPLCAGACLVMRGEAPWGPDDLARQLHDERVTVADIPTTYWHRFAQSPADPLAGAPLRLLLIGGEAALASAAAAHARPFPTLNAYGPTEATVTASVGIVGEGARGRGPFVPIGRPSPGTRMYVLDDALRLVPRGVAGEIHLGGDRLARGYLLRPGLTAERFVPDPFGPPGSRMYRTGDRGRVLADGSVEYLGRLDEQVKLRGVRIELGEIENALRAHPSVREAAVVLCGELPEDHVLSAHVVLDRAGAADAVRLHARACLPAAFVPGRWHFPDALPLTPHGKVDRRALAARTARPDPAMAATPPGADAASTLDHVLAAAARLAPAGSPGADDDLVERGFHSMLLVRLASSLDERFGSRLALRDLVRLRTPRALADFLDASRRH